MMRFVLGFWLALAVAAPALAFDHRPELRRTERALSSHDPVEVARVADRALAGMIRVATRALEQRGFDRDAGEIRARWEGEFRGFLPRLMERRAAGLEEIGDHAPLSEWLVEVYIKLEDALGPTVMELLHLDDIWIMNFAIPVVFHLAVIGDDVVELGDYGEHWTPFCGVASYWTIELTCSFATSGALAFVVCPLAGAAGEYVTVRWIAPPLADDAYRFLYRP